MSLFWLETAVGSASNYSINPLEIQAAIKLFHHPQICIQIIAYERVTCSQPLSSKNLSLPDFLF